jgi:sterol desaturase/sphingolipid hydroxylase (fatty acid hydroxylase superfamily)
MAEINEEVRDKRGEWKPENSPEGSPLFSWPLRFKKILKYYFGPQGFFFPNNLFYALLAVVCWIYFTPELSRAETFAFGWIAEIYLRNSILIILFVGILHLRLYIKKAQGEKYKYTDKWMDKGNKKFLFGNQVWDNIFWNLTSGSLIWTAYEAVTLWMYANGRLPYIDFKSHPVYFILLMMAIPFLRLIHFYFIHKWSHWPPLYKISHYLHHKNINIGPWSGLSMHPIEHLLYFSGVLLHWIIPSHPIHGIFHLMHAGLSPAPGHTGFHKLVLKGKAEWKTDHYFHYLHHKYFTVNFGVESVPLDKWFGSYHDGSDEAHEEMLRLRKEKKQKKDK